jgi:hypothetical protein
MLAFLSVVMGQALCEDASVCASEQLNLLQLRNGRTTNDLGVDPDVRDTGGQKDAPPKVFTGSTSFVELNEEYSAASGRFRLSASDFTVDGLPPSASEDWKGPPGDYTQIWGGKGRHFWPVALNGFEAVVWQCKSSNRIKLTYPIPNQHQTVTLLELDAEARLSSIGTKRSAANPRKCLQRNG